MERHHRRLADAEDIKCQQHPGHRIRNLARKNAAIGKVQSAGSEPSPHDGEEEGADGGGEEDTQVNAPAALGLRRPVVGDQRIRGNAEDFVRKKKRQQVAGEGNEHRAEQGDGEEGVELRLIVLVMTAHVADRIDRGHDPQEAGDQGESHAQRLELERDRQSRQHFAEHHLRPAAGHDLRHQRGNQEEHYRRRHQGDRLAQVRTTAGQDDQRRAEEGRCKRQLHGHLRAHLPPPISRVAAACATSNVRPASIPK